MDPHQMQRNRRAWQLADQGDCHTTGESQSGTLSVPPRVLLSWSVYS